MCEKEQNLCEKNYTLWKNVLTYDDVGDKNASFFIQFVNISKNLGHVHKFYVMFSICIALQ